jgi:Zn-dependent alcohol dehydrogenase
MPSWRNATRTGAGSRGISSPRYFRGVRAVRRFHPSGRCGDLGSKTTIAVGNVDVEAKAAVLWELGGKWEVGEVDLDPPKAGEVMIKLTASGLCHSDYHLVTGDIPVGLPYVGGHEGAAEVGPGVTDVAVGDSVVLSFLPACGKCSYCARGMTNLCDLGAQIIQGPQLDGTYRFHSKGQGRGH